MPGAGPCEVTPFLLDRFKTVMSVDGSRQIVDDLESRFGDRWFEAVCSYFEELDRG